MATDETENGDDKTLDGQFLCLKRWVIQDRRANSTWYPEAKTDYRFATPGADQWETPDRTKVEDNGNVAVSFNRIAPSVAAVQGMEVSNRQEVTYLPRTTQTAAVPPANEQPGPMGLPVQQPVPGADDTGPAEIYTGAGQYMRDQCDAEDEESDAFGDTAICGMGWTETRVDYDEDPAGMITVDRVDPLEMGWDCKSSKRNLVDSRRFHRIRELDPSAAREMFPGYDVDEIDAGWARPNALTNEMSDADIDRYYLPDNDAQQAQPKSVCVVEITWYETESLYRVSDRTTGTIEEMTDAKLVKKARERAEAIGRKINVQKISRRRYKYAFLGANEILDDVLDCQSQKGWKWNCITGTRDRNKNQWVGIVRTMRDPQRWANALYSSVLNSILTSGKGIMAERSAFEDPSKAEDQWSSSADIVWLREGALSGQNPKVMPKTASQLPPAIDKMLEFALTSMREVSGVNIETLGLADREQAASLEYQRRQAATTMLAPFFDGLRRYRKQQGRLMLDLIRNYLSDGRLVRIVGPDYEKYVPLLKDDSVTEFDIIVDESPSSPNQKEATWMILQQMMPVLMKQALPPEAWGKLLKASPLPSIVVDEFTESVQKAQANQGPSPEQMKIEADLQIQQMNAQTQQQKQQGDMAIAQQKAQADLTLKSLDIEIKKLEYQLEQFKVASEIQISRENMQMERERHAMAKEQAAMGMAVTREKTDSAISIAKTKAKQAKKPVQANAQ